MKQIPVPHLPRALVGDLLVHGDVEVVARLVRQEQADGDRLGLVREADRHLDLGLQDPQFPDATTVPHDHTAHGVLQLMSKRYAIG